MTWFLKFYPSDAILLITINALVQIAVVVALAWALSLVFARHRAAVRHGIWLAALSCVFVSPIMAYVAGRADLSLVSLRLLPQWAEGPMFTQPNATPSLLHTSRSSSDPEGRLTIAQQFTAGEMVGQDGLRPVGTLERGISRHDFNRPSGTSERILPFSDPGSTNTIKLKGNENTRERTKKYSTTVDIGRHRVGIRQAGRHQTSG